MPTFDEQYDAVVIGGGPGGLTAAERIARRGHRVLVVEKHRRIGAPVCCAEAISTWGLTTWAGFEPDWVVARIEAVDMIPPSGRRWTLHHPDAGFVLDRVRFEGSLAGRAAASGATVRSGVEAIGLMKGDDGNGMRFGGVRLRDADGNEGTVGADYIVGADGVESLVGRWAGLDTVVSLDHVDIAAQYLVRGLNGYDQTRMEFHFSAARFPGGYGWVFPKGNDTANVGLGISPPLAGGKTALAHLDEFMAERFPKCEIVSRHTGAIPEFAGRKFMLRDNIIFVGDAARLVNSLSGEGIAHALSSGRMAGDAVAVAIEDDDIGRLKEYPKQWMALQGRSMRYMLWLRQIYLKMSDADFDTTLAFFGEMFDGRNITGFQAIPLMKQFLRAHPQMLKLARHLVW